MTDYSFSRIQVFKQCPFRYKAMYIDHDHRTFKSVEGFMGGLVHKALRELHDKASSGLIMTADELSNFYDEVWTQTWTDDIIINKAGKTAEDYRRSGKAMLYKYHQRYQPFDQMQVVGLETNDRLNLRDGNRYYVRIDRLGRVGSAYYVCDYKTGEKGISHQDVESDQQLGMYALWVARNCPEADRVIMRWYSLSNDQEIDLEGDLDRLFELERKVVQDISQIEKCQNFPTDRSGLCTYCQHQDICPEFQGGKA